MKNCIVVDVETSGFSVRDGGRVIEVGAVALENGAIVGELSSLINADATIHYGAYRVHGISREMLRGQPSPAEVWRSFHQFVGNAPLAAHNATFDSSFIRHELALLGLPLANPWHCTVRLARAKLPHLANHRLDTVYCHLFGTVPATAQRHRALDDARMAARIWIELS